MNKQKSSKKSWFILIIVIVLGAIVYFYLQGNSPAVSDSLTQSSAPDVNAQVLNLLNQIQSLKIDPTLFKDPAYLTLRDYSVTIPQENVGRTNPFAPIPGFTLNPPAKH